MSEPDANGWLPIESAPLKEGASVLLGWDLEGNWPPCIGFWSGDSHGLNVWCDDSTGNDFTPQPTHYQPIPKPPVGGLKDLRQVVGDLREVSRLHAVNFDGWNNSARTFDGEP